MFFLNVAHRGSAGHSSQKNIDFFYYYYLPLATFILQQLLVPLLASPLMDKNHMYCFNISEILWHFVAWFNIFVLLSNTNLKASTH